MLLSCLSKTQHAQYLGSHPFELCLPGLTRRLGWHCNTSLSSMPEACKDSSHHHALHRKKPTERMQKSLHCFANRFHGWRWQLSLVDLVVIVVVSHTRPASPATPIIIPLPTSVATSTDAATAADLDACQQQWTSLVDRFGAERLLKHSWEWVLGDYLPLYTFQPVTCIMQVWDEYVAGLNGFLAVRDLDERWQARWRRNISTLRTENC
ncbi:hypothetical protein DFJ58DRAFT_803769 [Suillus subalutaceus]|uniref:uncharacterized protein n=1 Tax=Suillus subalutaceus TaxID=48586 RepID=UPI001B86ACAE|nr:uncharacterized protein DFJ58DRAFT_803769 [Suillus subalutaceus]KAG1843937.1 hypothetical protein DFJ58DRAFT_803769 [Suillus subalutaceus]